MRNVDSVHRYDAEQEAKWRKETDCEDCIKLRGYCKKHNLEREPRLAQLYKQWGITV